MIKIGYISKLKITIETNDKITTVSFSSKNFIAMPNNKITNMNLKKKAYIAL